MTTLRLFLTGTMALLTTAAVLVAMSSSALQRQRDAEAAGLAQHVADDLARRIGRALDAGVPIDHIEGAEALFRQRLEELPALISLQLVDASGQVLRSAAGAGAGAVAAARPEAPAPVDKAAEKTVENAAEKASGKPSGKAAVKAAESAAESAAEKAAATAAETAADKAADKASENAAETATAADAAAARVAQPGPGPGAGSNADALRTVIAPVLSQGRPVATLRVLRRPLEGWSLRADTALSLSLAIGAALAIGDIVARHALACGVLRRRRALDGLARAVDAGRFDALVGGIPAPAREPLLSGLLAGLRSAHEERARLHRLVATLRASEPDRHRRERLDALAARIDDGDRFADGELGLLDDPDRQRPAIERACSLATFALSAAAALALTAWPAPELWLAAWLSATFPAVPLQPAMAVGPSIAIVVAAAGLAAGLAAAWPRAGASAREPSGEASWASSAARWSPAGVPAPSLPAAGDGAAPAPAATDDPRPARALRDDPPPSPWAAAARDAAGGAALGVSLAAAGPGSAPLPALWLAAALALAGFAIGVRAVAGRRADRRARPGGAPPPPPSSLLPSPSPPPPFAHPLPVSPVPPLLAVRSGPSPLPVPPATPSGDTRGA